MELSLFLLTLIFTIALADLALSYYNFSKARKKPVELEKPKELKVHDGYKWEEMKGPFPTWEDAPTSTPVEPWETFREEMYKQPISFHDPIEPRTEIIQKMYAIEPSLIEEIETVQILTVLDGDALEVILNNVRPGNVINIFKDLDITEDKAFNQKSKGFNWDYEIEFYLNGKTYLLEGDGFNQNTCKFSLKL